MSDHSVTMALVRAQLAQLRLIGHLLHAMIERQLLTKDQARAMIEDSAAFLDDAGLAPTTVRLLRESYERLAADL